MPKYLEYDYVVVGAGIAGCATSYFLSEHSDSVLLVDKNEKVAFGASGAAGAFLSPLLGKDNAFKSLITKSLKFSTQFYKSLKNDLLTNCGVCRIPKNQEDRDKFESYKTSMDFEYEEMGDGYFFPIGAQVNPSDICEYLTKDINTKLNYEINDLKQNEDDNSWIINNEIKAKDIILSTGADTRLIKEKYFNIRAVWGQKIDVSSTSKPNINYHKECSISKAIPYKDDLYKVSLGATHHRFDCDKDICNYCVEVANINSCSRCYKSDMVDADSLKLISLANDIIPIDNVNVLDVKIGARASSLDYFPMVGKLVDSAKSIEAYPHILNGSFIKEENLKMIENLHVINGVGGRGFVLSPYLAKSLVDNIINEKELDSNITTYRLFKRWAKRLKNKKK